MFLKSSTIYLTVGDIYFWSYLPLTVCTLLGKASTQSCALERCVFLEVPTPNLQVTSLINFSMTIAASWLGVVNTSGYIVSGPPPT